MKRSTGWGTAVLVPGLAPEALAATAADGQCVYPVIRKFGGVHPPPRAAVQPDANAT